ncbi:MAG: D-serine deaminase-like pyridoxal phosphate-dependent protein [Saprospiraceae bacterium]|jgi:D-serine deaminase-like pyridoxal phosphate-dependent protein
MTWYEVESADSLSTPALLVYPDRVASNIKRAISIIGDTDRLRPHVKTHKMLEVGKIQVAAGLSRFKCATIAEAEMMAMAGAKDVLVAYQLLGPRISQLEQLKNQYPDVIFSSLIDSIEGLDFLKTIDKTSSQIHVYIDLNVGQNRTGIKIGSVLTSIIERLVSDDTIAWEGFHVYDGHITESDLEFRTDDVERAISGIASVLEKYPQAKIVAGGSPTFGVHALHEDRECSPGTFVFWDYGYQSKYPEYQFQYAAVIATRIISKLDDHTFCLDLGYKHISAEITPPHIHFLNVGPYQQRGHSEEHLVIRFKEAQSLQLGDVLYGIPRHVCPTVALYNFANVVEDAALTGKWNVIARDLELG